MAHFSTWAASNEKKEMKALADKYSGALDSAKVLEADFKKAAKSKDKKDLEALRKLAADSGEYFSKENKKHAGKWPRNIFLERLEKSEKELLAEAKKDYETFQKEVATEVRELEAAVDASIREGDPGNISASGVKRFQDLVKEIDAAIAAIKD